MKSILKWVVGVLLLLNVLILAQQGSFITATFYLLGGLVSFPPTFKIIEEKIKFQFQTWHKYMIVIGAILIGGATLPKNNNTIKFMENNVTSKIQVAPTQTNTNSGNITENDTTSKIQVAPTQTNKNSDNTIKPRGQLIETQELTNRLQWEITSSQNPFDNSDYRGSTEAVKLELILFGSWSLLIEEGEVSLNLENQKLAKKLKANVIARQIKEFPLMRKEITKIMKQKLWEDDIKVSCFGESNSTLDFVGISFASHKMIKETQETLSEMMHMYRFKRSQYHWISDADEYTSYTINSPNDGKLITF